MERRDAIKALSAIPMMVIGAGAGRAVEINSKSKYVVFVNPRSIDVEDFCKHPEQPFPAGTPVFVVYDSDMDNAVRIFELKE